MTSGHGGVFPPGLAVGVVALIANGNVRIRPFVDWDRLEYVRLIEFNQFDIKDAPYEVDGNLQLASGVLSVGQLHFSAPRGSVSGNLSVSLENPREFGQFDLVASGDNLDEFIPTLLEYRPAAVPFDLKTRGRWDTQGVHIESGILVGLTLGVVQDITVRVNREQELMLKDALANQAEAITDIGHFIYDEINEKYLFVSPGLANIYGREVEVNSATTVDVTVYIAADLIAKIGREAQKVVKRDTAITIEITF